MPPRTSNFLVGRDDLRRTEIVSTEAPRANDGQIVVSVDAFAFTANNITYAVMGDAMQYWDFYPAPAGWGCIPVWGFGNVTESKCPGISAGERLFGYWPMSTHAVLEPAQMTAATFHDATAHRQHLHTVYNQYIRTSGDPGYVKKHEDLQMLFRVLFLTAFLIDDFIADNDFFGATSIVLASASSKTALSLAYQLHRNRRGRCEVVGLTSPHNEAFVNRLGCYDKVVAYEDISSLPSNKSTVFVDMAGDGRVLRDVHSHFRRSLKYSCMVGGTHWDQIAMGQELPGPVPTLFFAPAQVAKRTQEWGPVELQRRMADAWTAFIEPASQWIHVVHSRGPAAVERIYRDMLEGRTSPSDGHVLSLHE
jgi:hypothetical protein